MRMELALTAGAVGDFISIAVLIKDIIAALDDSRGSAKQYRELVQQLNTLDQTLDTVQQTLKDPRVTHYLEFISGIMLDTVTNIKKCLVDFLGQISKYEPALGTSAPVNKASLTGAWMKIQRKANGNFRKVQWKLNEKDIDKFRAEVMGYTMALEIALGVITLRVLQRNYDSLAKDQSDTERRTANLIRRSKTSLKRSLDSVGRGIVSKLEIIHSLGTQIKTTTCHIVSSIQSIAADVNSIKAIVMHLDRGPGDDHFILEDITGRRFPIHLKTITSWAVLEFILEERFKGKKGARRIQQKRYTLRESKTHREIDGSILWDSAFLPYQEVNMSLMCNEVESNDTNGKAASSCPFCKMLSDSLASTGVEVKCESCGRFFTRVVEVDHVKLNQVPGFLAESRCSETTSDEHACTRFRESTNISPQTRPRMGPLPSISGYDSDDEDVRGFVRVHLVSKKIRATEHLAIEDPSNHIINHESDLTAPVLHPHSMQELGSTTSCCILPPWRQEKHKKVWHQNPPISNLIPFAPTYTLKKIPYDWDAKRVWNDHLYGITVKKPNSRATYSSRFYG